MAIYPIKMLKDEEGNAFVPLTSSEALKTPDGKTLDEKLQNKLETTNIKAGTDINITVDGNNVTINNASKGVLIDNLTTETPGVGSLDAHQGKVLKDMIPEVVNNVTSTDSDKALSAYQGYLLSGKVVPTGGKEGQVLKKSSDTNWSLEWGDAADPNAIVGDGSIKKIVELTYEEYQALETIDPDTEYHIIDAQSSVDNLADFIETIILEADKRKHPIGSLEFNVSGTNPSVYLGFGTWELWGAGRVPVGVDTAQEEFNTVEKTGGSKYLQSHNHNIWQAAGSEIRLSYGSGGTYNKIGLTYNWDAFPDNESFISTTDVNSLSTGHSGNLPPYITCYMWKRVL